MLSAIVTDSDIRTTLDNIKKFNQVYTPLFKKLLSVGYGVQTLIWSYDGHPISLVFQEHSVKLVMLRPNPLISFNPLNYLNRDETLATTTDDWKLMKYFSLEVYNDKQELSNQKAVSQNIDILGMIQDVLSDLLSDDDTIQMNFENVKQAFNSVVMMGLRKQGLHIANPVNLELKQRSIDTNQEPIVLKVHQIKYLEPIDSTELNN